MNKYFRISFLVIIALMLVLSSFIYYKPIPIYASTTETYYTSGTSDGDASRTTDGTWTSLVTGNGESSSNTGSTSYPTQIESASTSNVWSNLHRGFYFFDTSALPDTATITSATLSLYGSYKADNLSITPNIGIYNTTSTNTEVATADYQTAGSTALSDTLITYAGFSASGYNDFTLNASGISAISKTGYSRFCIRNQNYDVANNAPTWSSSVNSIFGIYNAERSGTSQDPKLSITYTLPPTVSSYSVEGVGKDWAILKGYVSSIGTDTITSVGVNYGLTTGYGSSQSVTTTLNSASYFLITLRNLSSNTTYHWQASATNVGGTATGSDLSFSTSNNRNSPVLFEYLNTGGNSDTAAIYGLNYGAMQFTSVYNAHTVSTVRVMLKRFGSPGTVNLSIRQASSGLPVGDDIITTTSLSGNSFSTSYSWITFTISDASPNTTLNGSSQYSIVISALSGDASNYVLWQIVSAGSLADAVASHSTDGGVSWSSDTPKDALFEIRGVSAFQILSGAEFDNYITTGDMLFTCEYINLWPDINGVTDAGKYFTLRLLGTDGTTVLGSTPMRAWGDKPLSIYLSPNSANGITKGSGLYLQLYGNGLASLPTTSYQLSSDDWRGSEKTFLDRWVLATADSMDGYYGLSDGTSLTTYTNQKGQVLANQTGGISIFLNGIPNLDDVRPDLFEVIVKSPPTSGQATTAAGFNSQVSYDTVVGSKISGDFTTFGSLVGLTGQAALGTTLLIISVTLGLIAVLMAGSSLSPVALMISMPLLFWGGSIRAIDIRVLAIIAGVFAFLALRKYIWSEG